MDIFNFISKKNPAFISNTINDRTQTASFTIDMVYESDILYRIACHITKLLGRKSKKEFKSQQALPPYQDITNQSEKIKLSDH